MKLKKNMNQRGILLMCVSRILILKEQKKYLTIFVWIGLGVWVCEFVGDECN